MASPEISIYSAWKDKGEDEDWNQGLLNSYYVPSTSVLSHLRHPISAYSISSITHSLQLKTPRLGDSEKIKIVQLTPNFWSAIYSPGFRFSRTFKLFLHVSYITDPQCAVTVLHRLAHSSSQENQVLQGVHSGHWCSSLFCILTIFWCPLWSTLTAHCVHSTAYKNSKKKWDKQMDNWCLEWLVRRREFSIKCDLQSSVFKGCLPML